MKKWVHAPIEFMVPNNPRVVFEMIEEINHQLAFAAQPHLGALINITDIDENRVSVLSAPPPNLRDATRQSAHIKVSVVIDRRQNVTVQIGRMQDRDADRIGRKRRN